MQIGLNCQVLFVLIVQSTQESWTLQDVGKEDYSAVHEAGPQLYEMLPSGYDDWVWNMLSESVNTGVTFGSDKHLRQQLHLFMFD